MRRCAGAAGGDGAELGPGALGVPALLLAAPAVEYLHFWNSQGCLQPCALVLGCSELQEHCTLLQPRAACAQGCVLPAAQLPLRCLRSVLSPWLSGCVFQGASAPSSSWQQHLAVPAPAPLPCWQPAGWMGTMSPSPS